MGNERHTIDDEGGLCYLEAGNVELPAGKLADLQLCSRDDQSLGAVEGVLIEPSARRVRYFVVKRDPGGCATRGICFRSRILAHVDRERNVLQIEACADDVPR